MNIFIERLKHDPRIVCGVSAKLAKEFGWSLMWTRVASAILVFFNPVMSLLAYIIAAVIISQTTIR